MLGGYAQRGRGPRWARRSRTTIVVGVLATVVAAAVSDPGPRGRSTNAVLALTLLLLLGLLACGCAIPHLPVQRRLVARP